VELNEVQDDIYQPFDVGVFVTQQFQHDTHYLGRVQNDVTGFFEK